MKKIQANQGILNDLNFSLHGMDTVSRVRLPVQQLKRFINCPFKDGMAFETFEFLYDLDENEDLSKETEIILYL